MLIGFVLAVLINADVSTSVMATPKRNTISIPYVMSARPNPFRIMWTGDWALSFHAWATLVDIDDVGNAVPRIATKWQLSPDGLVWRFQLLPNLKWSDGSPMTDSEIEASLKVSLAGTSHTNLSESIKNIEVKNHIVTFYLKRALPAFLANLAYVDWAIVHPKAIQQKNDEINIVALTPCSGPYCVEEVHKTGVVSEHRLIANPHSIFAQKMNLTKGKIIHHESCNALVQQASTLLAFRSYSEGFSDECREKLKNQGFELAQSHPTWILKADYTSTGMKNFNVTERQWLNAQVYDSLKKTPPKFGVIRATGLRAPHLFGSLSDLEYGRLLEKLVSPAQRTKNILKGRKLKLVTMEQWSHWQSFSWLKSLLVAASVNVEVKIFKKEEFAKARSEKVLDREYDLIFLPLGTSDPDPDNTWRIASRNLYADTLDQRSIKAAFLEKNREKRAELYRKLGEKIIEQGRMIPIMMDADIIGVHESARFEGVPQYRCGMTLYELTPTNR